MNLNHYDWKWIGLLMTLLIFIVACKRDEPTPEPDPVTFSSASSKQGTAAITTYQWASGDGNNSGQVTQNSFTTIYDQPGVFYPSVTVADASGLSGSASMAVTINANLEGTAWILENTVPGTSISLQFARGTLSGFASCNSYSADYTTTLAAGPTNNITVGPITSGRAICDEPIMNQEQSYLASLGSASSYTISGATLTLTTAGNPLIFNADVPTLFITPALDQ